MILNANRADPVAAQDDLNGNFTRRDIPGRWFGRELHSTVEFTRRGLEREAAAAWLGG